MPKYTDRAERLQEWNDVLVLLVEPSRLARWYCPGLLLIGDAAHVMAPVGNVGIISAIQDAMVTANVLSSTLNTGHLQIHDLARVQHKRELSIRFIQWVQALIQLRECAERGASGFSNKLPVMPDFIHMLPHLPLVRNLPNRILTLGIPRVHVKNKG
jgi:2-polyprenyl-6-methoxyphenol hydroxylase-like FAD-dependent oxidoreductase